MATSPHVSVIGLSQRFDSTGKALVALDGVDLNVRRGEFLSIIGPSGCGKTTLLRVVGGLLRPSAGTVLVGDSDPGEAQARKEIGFVFQDPALLPWRTVMDNVRLPLQVNRRGRERTAFGIPRRGGVAPPSGAAELVDMVGLGDFAGYYPHQLSGGMRQRVALARALVFDPSLLLMDEPLGALDEITRGVMRYELLRVWEITHKTVVMVTHGISEAVALSDRVAVMSGLPGRMRRIIDIEIPRPRDERMERSDAFLEYVEQIKGLLRDGPVAPAVDR